MTNVKEELAKAKVAKEAPAPVKEQTIIDATDLKLGRLASTVAKRALNGEEIIIVNAEAAVITGNHKATYEKYDQKLDIGTRYWGPFPPKRPDLMLKRTIRGMVPYKRKRGREALERIRAYIGVPLELEGKKFESISSVKIQNTESRKYITVQKLAGHLGYKNG